MTNNKLKKYLPMLIITVDIILVLFLLWSMYKVNSLSNQNALIKWQVDELIDKKSKLSTNKSEVGRLDESLMILNSYFVSSEERVSMIDNLEKLAGKSNVGYVLNNAIEGDRMSLDIGVKGSFRNIYYFIRLLETSGYWVSFEKVSLSRSTEGGIGSWSGSIVVNIPNSDK